MVVGAPYGLAHSMSVGWISARWPPNTIFRDSEGLGFVVTINSAQKLLIDRKVFWGALQGVLLTGDLAAIFNVPAPAGFLVKTVAQDSMAWNMGLQGGDRIVTIGGKELALGGDIILSVHGIPVVSEDNIEKIRNTLAGLPPGTPFKMSVLRAGRVIELTSTTQSTRATARWRSVA
jgi:serine protease Do